MSIKRQLQTLGGGLLSLVYPNLCLNCRRPVTRQQTPQICVPCYSRLPYTEHWKLPENETTDRLLGRLPLEVGVALLIFRDGSVCQSLIHALKYYGRAEVGTQLGRQLGEFLREVPALADLDGIVPVPIHPDRRHDRGYNQAEKMADGLSAVLGVRQFPNALRRPVFGGSQTRRNRFERVENTRESFAIGSGAFAGKHLLLVDDVLTTGATLDFCGNILLDHHPGLRLSVATLAITESG